MLPTELIQTRPATVQVEPYRGGVRLRSKVQQTWWVLPKAVLAMVLIYAVAIMGIIAGETSADGGDFFYGICFVLGLFLLSLLWSIGLQFFGKMVVHITAHGFQQQLFMGQWVSGRKEGVAWKDVTFMALVLGFKDRPREIQIVQQVKGDLELRKYYSPEQVTYLEQCLQYYHQQYKTAQLEGETDVDWSAHLIED